MPATLPTCFVFIFGDHWSNWRFLGAFTELTRPQVLLGVEIDMFYFLCS
jgi:hypothetical protein